MSEEGEKIHRGWKVLRNLSVGEGDKEEEAEKSKSQGAKNRHTGALDDGSRKRIIGDEGRGN